MRDARPGCGRVAGLIAALDSLAARRAFPLLVASLAVLLALPALGVGWIMDDYYHRVILLERSPLCALLGKPSEMFRFFTGDPVRTEGLMDVGIFPWWTDPEIKGEFLQALPVLTHRLDYLIWPDSPVLMHAHGLAWFGAAAAMAAAFYRRMFGASRVAAVAALLYALDDARGPTVGFIANRNVLVAATFGIAALICHDRWRRGGSLGSAFLAPPLLLAALFSKEEGIGICAYLAAYALFVDPAGVRRGCLALLPAVAAAAAWWMLRASWGYGVRDMGIYIDPVSDPGRFLEAAAVRIPLLLFGQWGPIPAEADIILGPGASFAFRAVALAYLGLLLWAIAPLLQRDRLARFWAAGMLLAAIPVAATLPMDRLLTFPALGAAGLLARFLTLAFGIDGGPPPDWRWPRLARGIAWFLVAVHAALAPLALPVRAANPIGLGWVERRLYVQELPGPSLEGRTVVVVNAPSPVHAGYFPLLRESAGLPPPARMRVLAPAIPAARIRRLDERTLAIRPDGGYQRWVLDRIFRSERRPLGLGVPVRLTGMAATVTDLTTDGRPAEATFRFDLPLEDPSLAWLCFRGRGFEPFALPAVGEEVEIRFDWRAMLAP
jgi:hypothetical protein